MLPAVKYEFCEVHVHQEGHAFLNRFCHVWMFFPSCCGYIERPCFMSIITVLIMPPPLRLILTLIFVAVVVKVGFFYIFFSIRVSL